VGYPLLNVLMADKEAGAIAVTRAARAARDGPTVLVGHSYEDVVITGAGAPGLVRLVYVAAQCDPDPRADDY